MKPLERIVWLQNEIYYLLHKREYPIADFKNKYQNQSCFIIGNGPSLQVNDLELLQNKHIITFGANFIYHIFDETSWRPTYLSVIDIIMFSQGDFIERMNKEKLPMLFTRSNFAKMASVLTCPTCVINSQKDDKFKTAKFSMDCTKIVYGLATVTYMNVQLAAFMGFKNIYLLGMDHYYTKLRLENGKKIINENTKSYFGNWYNEEKAKTDAPGNMLYRMDKVYQKAEEVSRTTGKFRIYNATRGGHLEWFERVNFDDVMNNWEN